MTGLMDQQLSTPAWLVLLAVFALPALESSAFLGGLFPGGTALLLGGVAAGQGHVTVAAVVVAGVVGAVLGGALGYLVGRRWGRRLLDSPLGRRLSDDHHREPAEHALLRRGGWAVFVGRLHRCAAGHGPGSCRDGRDAAPPVLGRQRGRRSRVGDDDDPRRLPRRQQLAHAEHDVSGAGAALTAAVLALRVGRRVLLRPVANRHARAERRTVERAGSGPAIASGVAGLAAASGTRPHG